MHQSTWIESQTGFSWTDPASGDTGAQAPLCDWTGMCSISLRLTSQITSFPLPFYHGGGKRYKCEKLPSWDTAKGGTRAAFCSGMYCKGVKHHAKYACRIGGEMVLIKLLIGTGLYVGALVSNVYWLVKHIASAGEEVRKRRENGGDYTRYGSYYGYYLRAVVLGTNIGALFCAIVHIIGKL